MLNNIVNLFVQNIKANDLTEVPLIKYCFILLPGSTCPFCELNKVFLSTGTDLMGQLTINVIKLGQIGFDMLPP